MFNKNLGNFRNFAILHRKPLLFCFYILFECEYIHTFGILCEYISENHLFQKKVYTKGTVYIEKEIFK